jgi:succinate dehydrogenase/fumarate reductase flavoprotein subunit
MENRDMSKVPHRLVVVGHGAAGLAAAVAAAEAARSHDLAVEITLLEKAAQEAAGGNTLWSPSYMRLTGRIVSMVCASCFLVETSFVFGRNFG